MAVTVNFYDHFLERLGDGGFDMDTDVFHILLMDNVHVFTAANTVYADISANELATQFGYTQNAKVLAGVTWAQTGGVVTFDFTDPSWTAAGGAIGPTTDAVIISNTANLLMASIDFGAAHTAEDGADLNVVLNASGLFTIT